MAVVAGIREHNHFCITLFSCCCFTLRSFASCFAHSPLLSAAPLSLPIRLYLNECERWVWVNERAGEWMCTQINILHVYSSHVPHTLTQHTLIRQNESEATQKELILLSLESFFSLHSVVGVVFAADGGAVAFVVALHYIPFELATFVHVELYHFFCMCWICVCEYVFHVWILLWADVGICECCVYMLVVWI